MERLLRVPNATNRKFYPATISDFLVSFSNMVLMPNNERLPLLAISLTEDACLVEMVLLGMPSCLDFIRVGGLAVW